MTSHQPATVRSLTRRSLLGASLSIAATILMTACGGMPGTQPAAAIPPVAPQVAAQPAAAPASVPIKIPVADASTTGGECGALTVADVKAITGEDVKPVAPREFAVGGNTCGNYVNAAGKAFLAVRILKSQSDITFTLESVMLDVYKVHEQPSGIGDQADLFKDTAQSPTMRYLVVRKGSIAVELMPFTSARSVTDDQLLKLAAKALATY